MKSPHTATQSGASAIVQPAIEPGGKSTATALEGDTEEPARDQRNGNCKDDDDQALMVGRECDIIAHWMFPTQIRGAVFRDMIPPQ